MTPAYVAKLAGVHVSVVYRDLLRGDLEGVRIGKNERQWYVAPEEAASWARWMRKHGTNEN